MSSTNLVAESPIERIERLERQSFSEPLRLNAWQQRWFLSHADTDHPVGFKVWEAYMNYLERWATDA